MKGYLKQDGEPTPDKPIKIEAKIPMFVDGELENFDNNIHSIIEEYSKMMFKEKDQILTQRIIMKQEQEIERLNNIINNANKVLQNILVIENREHKGKYRPIKNTSKNDVYKSVCMLYGILGTPYRCDCGSLQEFKRADVMNEETINGIIRYNKRAAKEIERLNNIINELEKWLDGYLKSIAIHNKIPESDEYALKEVIDKVKELKGDSSND